MHVCICVCVMIEFEYIVDVGMADDVDTPVCVLLVGSHVHRF
jgi:hypothetical protein